MNAFKKKSSGLPKVLVVVGPTASGKTGLAITLAKKYNGEVVSADSRQVYTGLDIGSGKVTREEMRGVPHHLLDVADPREVYTISDFVRDGRKAIASIHKKKKVPIIAGGTFFYVDALIGTIQAPEVPPNPTLRDELNAQSTESLYTILLEQDPRRATDIDPHNKRRIIRALEVVHALGKVPKQEAKTMYDAYIIGIETNKNTLRKQIHNRLIARMNNGMIEEAKRLCQEGVPYERMDELGLEYRYLAKYLQKQLTKDELIDTLETKIAQFAKRQMTWLRHMSGVHWYACDEEAKIFETIGAFLGESVMGR
ncbi:tRNA (adenosine(37)-N6)-dimethylallyltransferase MiaA [Candidatus Kaiserbacteria bacterium]|nr:tRNA (adenosine(37)-N6)-dimethylallyltransferase MiaA [Candidatus Kaiserbacteria bacterium]